jgi:PKD domain
VPDVSGGTSLTFQLTVTDDSGFEHRDTCIVSVNGPPVASAGPDQAINSDLTVLLDGTGSNDPGGNIVSYEWLQAGGSPVVTISNSGSAVASFTAPRVGAGGADLTFLLTVTDNHGARREDTCSVHVSAAPGATSTDSGGGGGGGCFISAAGK